MRLSLFFFFFLVRFRASDASDDGWDRRLDVVKNVPGAFGFLCLIPMRAGLGILRGIPVFSYELCL